MTEQMFSEAPASINIKTVSPGGFDVMVTIRDSDTSALMPRMLSALEWLSAQGFNPTTNGYKPRTSRNGNSAPMCPTHSTPMKQSKHGSGWYCPTKIADDDGAGKPVYCKQRVK